MKYFLTKVICLVVIAVILLGYQVNARSLSIARGTLEARAETLKEQGTYKDGEYSGTADGYQGPLTVRVLVKDGQIREIEITETKDDPAYVVTTQTMIDEIIKQQTTEDIDTVSGATYSSTGILNAVKKALEGAGS